MADRMSRAQDADHLAAMAQHLHPLRPPRWDFKTRSWVWVPPWATSTDAVERLGGNWLEASATLHRLAAAATCEHGRPLTSSCDGCRSRIIGALELAA